MAEVCQSCGLERPPYRTAMLSGKYYKRICNVCLNAGDEKLSGNAAGNDRRRQWEQYAADTIQPYNAKGPNSEFYRLYPEQAEKTFTREEIDEIKRKL